MEQVMMSEGEGDYNDIIASLYATQRIIMTITGFGLERLHA